MFNLVFKKTEIWGITWWSRVSKRENCSLTFHLKNSPINRPKKITLKIHAFASPSRLGISINLLTKKQKKYEKLRAGKNNSGVLLALLLWYLLFLCVYQQNHVNFSTKTLPFYFNIYNFITCIGVSHESFSFIF